MLEFRVQGPERRKEGRKEGRLFSWEIQVLSRWREREKESRRDGET
jgi:hypothetical protein